jgi:hypothetical protein
MSADGALEGEALADLNEMEAADIDHGVITVVALVDRAEGYASAADDWSDTRVYEITHDPAGPAGSAIVSSRVAAGQLDLAPERERELNTGRPETLASFLAFVGEAYPAERTALILWGAGSGYRAVSIDEGSGEDPLLTGELPTAFEGGAPDVVALDLAFGAQLEIAYELAPFTSTLVASQQVVGTAGWDYRRFLEELAARSDSFAGAAHSAFSAAYAGTPGACISTVDLARLPDLMWAFNGLSTRLHEHVTTAQRRDDLRGLLFDDVAGFYATPGEVQIDIADTAQAVGTIYPSVADAAAEVQRAVGGTVRAQWCAPGSPEGARGLSVHLVPVDSGGYAYPPHADSYFAGRVVDDPLRFVSDSAWVPDEESGDGLLYRLWYEAM